MKVLHLASEFPPARIFGLGRYVHDLARAQVRRGHEVHVLTNSLSGKEQDALVHGIHVHRIHFPGPPMPADGATQVVQFNLCLLERACEIRQTLETPDAIVAHDWLTVLSADTLRRQFGGRLVFTIHDTVIGKTSGKMINEDKFIALVERWGCQIADTVIAVSSHVRGELAGVYEAPVDKLRVVPCAVDAAWFQSVPREFLADLKAAIAAPEDIILSYVGRLDPEKGVDVLIKAFAALRTRFPRLRLRIAGKGNEQPKLESLAKQLGVEKEIRFLGYVAGPALEAFYKVSNILVCPSTYEPFGIVPLEGMVNGLPVIVSDTGGMAEIVEHDKSGLKVTPGDVAALATAIAHLVENPQEAQRLARAGQDRARRVYNWDRVAEMTEPLYSNGQSRGHLFASTNLGTIPHGRPKLTAGIRVKNGERFAEECLRELSDYVDEIVILDDGSTDRTVEIARSFPKVTQVVRWQKDFFHEGIDRNVVLALAKDTSPDWILLPDIDEVFEDRFKEEVHRMMAVQEVSLYVFLFCHFWRSRTHYRVDGKWGRETREFPIPRLVRNEPGLRFPVHRPLGTAQITGVKGKVVLSDIRVKHYGHLYEDISRHKVEAYSALDPESDYSYMVDEHGLALEEWREREPLKMGMAE
jgi:glycosyltransferase involved in cell wall biosynthesis